MPEVTISIGGRDFEVACREGEEPFLQSAAKMLDNEAQVLSDQVGRMPEARMLLMAGLMLADRAASMEDRVAKVESELKERDAELEALRNAAPPEPERIEVPVIPDQVTDTLAEIAARTEALAAKLQDSKESA
ncbi:cell division protein ZapA [Aliishimia ponticola]|uniref:Cell division protein ZapA n=1 Tax=Aliishimia ponticola TaxID=2499833 RepID=A0A4S4NFN1_9RHOB|nr:cell division protein ZapA [Aliishimia ponticola]THH38359.1 cell division protein ZapA [Aliishimia ponticola]